MKIINPYRNQAISALVLLLAGAVPIACSRFYQPHLVSSETETASQPVFMIPEYTIPKASGSDAARTGSPSDAAEAECQPSAKDLNLAHAFPEGADQTDPMNSYAGMAYRELMSLEERWISRINQMSEENPSVRSLQIAASDGDGNPITSFSNVKEIISMANVYTYYKDPGNYELFLEYVTQLWKDSRSYSCQLSDLYYCSGCLKETEATPSEATDQSVEAATVSDASSVSSTDVNCPGHMDLIVCVKITGLNGQNNLFGLDRIGNDPDGISADGWPGWNDETMEAARALSTQNWFDTYGLSISLVSAADTLNAEEINSYMNALPQDLSQTRRDLIRFALESVGRVPYYWGGKASHPGYEGNRFGSLVSPDPEGRILKGLDCSGWISWIYWSVTGERLPYESTAGMTAVGIPISKEELKPGDLIFRTGDNAHAILFLGWTSDGRILCIHESSDTANNVTISEKNTNWLYFRSLTD